ncbi:hypothetical protein VTN49DRAFT_991 [Thermomyces lanuginosus]|uniref:uncharacterized protein n=1 Tax=Thermomyces lanuginosus TaxID=5541 RepID=UPI003743360C
MPNVPAVSMESTTWSGKVSNCLIALLHLHNSPSERFIIVGISAFLSFEHCILHPAIEVLVGVTLFLPSRSDAPFRNQTDNNTIMTTPGCLSPIWQWIKTQFRSKREPKQLEIGYPTNFRKEKLCMPVTDDANSGVLSGHDSRQRLVSEKQAVSTAVPCEEDHPSLRQLHRELQQLGLNK